MDLAIYLLPSWVVSVWFCIWPVVHHVLLLTMVVAICTVRYFANRIFLEYCTV